MIVKNEEKNIEKALSWGKGIVAEQIVVDTGSTDRTVEIAKAMGAQVYYFQWIDDFAAAKNFAIEKARYEWIALLDADEYFTEEDARKLPAAVWRAQENRCDGIATGWIQLDDQGRITSADTQIRVFRNGPTVRYKRRIHEYLSADNHPPVVDVRVNDLSIFHTGYTVENYKKKRESRRNLNLILAELEEHPKEWDMWGYLGNEYDSMKDYEEAEKAYRKGISLMPEHLRENDAMASVIFTRLLQLLTFLPKPDEAAIMDVYEKAVRSMPKEADFDYMVGQYYASHNQPQLGEKHLLRALKILEQHGNMAKSENLSGNILKTYEMLAICCFNSGKLSECIRYGTILLKEDHYLMSTLVVLLSAFSKDEGTVRMGEEGAMQVAGFLKNAFYDFYSLKDRLFVLRAAMAAKYEALVAVMRKLFTPEEMAAVDRALEQERKKQEEQEQQREREDQEPREEQKREDQESREEQKREDQEPWKEQKRGVQEPREEQREQEVQGSQEQQREQGDLIQQEKLEEKRISENQDPKTRSGEGQKPQINQGSQKDKEKETVSEEKKLRIVLFYSEVESFNFFTDRLDEQLKARGHETFIMDLRANVPEDNPHSYVYFNRFIAQDVDAAICFDALGVRTDLAINIWNQHQAVVVDILMDAPTRIHGALVKHSQKYILLCCDRDHVEYVKRYYRQTTPDVYFMPHVGVMPGKDALVIPYQEKTYDILFSGTYYPPENKLSDLHAELDQTFPGDKGIHRFYGYAYENLLRDSSLTVEQAILATARQLGWEVSDDLMKALMYCADSLDWAVRMYYRGQVVKTLAEAGVHLHLLGRGWENHPSIECSNVCQINDRIPYENTLAYMADAKINLNVMPWFKAGTHDRIFNTLLQRSVPLTDSSTWIDENFTDGKDIALYDLKHLDRLPEIVNRLLADEKLAETIISNGYEKIARDFTWTNCADQILHYITNAYPCQ